MMTPRAKSASGQPRDKTCRSWRRCRSDAREAIDDATHKKQTRGDSEVA